MDTNKALIHELENGGIAVIPTDTLYGIVASTLKPQAVEKVYQLRRRSPAKPCIILISDQSQLETLGIHVDAYQQKVLDQYWPGPVSMILSTTLDASYLHRGTKTLAVRLPNNDILRQVIRQTGPLIAPSANLEGHSPAITIREAHTYFADTVGTYIDGGTLQGKPSGLIDITKSAPKIIRPLI